jgi:hypothetical protein
MGAPPRRLDQPMGASWRLDQPMGTSSRQLDQSVVSDADVSIACSSKITRLSEEIGRELASCALRRKLTRIETP